MIGHGMNWYKTTAYGRSVEEWVKYIEEDPRQFSICPFRDLEEPKKARIRGQINLIKDDPYAYYPQCPDFLKNLPEIQDALVDACKRTIIDRFFEFDLLYKNIKETSTGQKLRREIAKFLYYKIKERPLFYYHMRTLNLDSDLRNDILTIAKHLKLTIANPWKEET